MITPVELDRPRNLNFTIQACCDMESVLGMSLGDVVHKIRTVSITVIRAALWAGLKHEDPQLTISGVGDLLEAYCQNGGVLKSVISVLDTAIANSTPLHSGTVSGNAKPKAR